MANQPQVFKYERPSVDSIRAKARKGGHAKLCSSDLVKGQVSIIVEGGENVLHYHTGNDGFWMVLEGHARFYGAGDVVVASLGKHQGILIPRGFSYWFESSGDQPLELLHVAAYAQNEEEHHVNADGSSHPRRPGITGEK